MLLALRDYCTEELICVADFDTDLAVVEQGIQFVAGPISLIDWVKTFFFGIDKHKYSELYDAMLAADEAIDLSGFALSEDFSKKSCTRRSIIYLLQALCAKRYGKRYVIGNQ